MPNAVLTALPALPPPSQLQAVAEEFVTSLGLEWNPYVTQIEPHDYIAGAPGWLDGGCDVGN